MKDLDSLSSKWTVTGDQGTFSSLIEKTQYVLLDGEKWMKFSPFQNIKGKYFKDKLGGKLWSTLEKRSLMFIFFHLRQC